MGRRGGGEGKGADKVLGKGRRGDSPLLWSEEELKELLQGREEGWGKGEADEGSYGSGTRCLVGGRQVGR